MNYCRSCLKYTTINDNEHGLCAQCQSALDEQRPANVTAWIIDRAIQSLAAVGRGDLVLVSGHTCMIQTLYNENRIPTVYLVKPDAELIAEMQSAGQWFDDLFLSLDPLRTLLATRDLTQAQRHYRRYWYTLVFFYHVNQKGGVSGQILQRRLAVLDALLHQERMMDIGELMTAAAERLTVDIQSLWGEDRPTSPSSPSPSRRALFKDITFLRNAGLEIRYSRSSGGYYIDDKPDVIQ